MLLRDKVVVVFGAAGSIGSTTARIFAREGARLFLAGRTLSKVEALAKDITNNGGAASAAMVDALDEAQVEKYLDEVVQTAGSLDVLFNAISMEDIQGPSLTTMPFEDFFHPIQKAESQFLTARTAARIMMQQGSGVLITITEPAGTKPSHACENVIRISCLFA